MTSPLASSCSLFPSLPRWTRPPMPRKAEISPAWSTSAAVARCIWSVAAQDPRPSCWWPASGVPPRIGISPRSQGRRCFPRSPSSPGSVLTTVLERRSVRSQAAATRLPQPTTAGNAVADLHALLTAAGETGPYVLVAHSYGGLIGRLYASTYPDEISGLVLVDALSEGLRGCGDA